MRKILVLAAVLTLFSRVVYADALTFIAQFDPNSGSTNYSWFSSQNWFALDVEGNLSPVGRVPLANETAMVTGTADAGVSGIRVQTLILTNAARVKHGTFSIEKLQMLDDSAFEGTKLNLVGSMIVNGTNCVLSACTLNMLGVSSATVASLQAGRPTSLDFADGTQVLANGLIQLKDGALLASSGTPQSKIILVGFITTSGNTILRGSGTNGLAIDNSGVIRVEDGKLSIEGGIEWSSTAGSGVFQADATNTSLVFNGPFQVPAGVTSLFTGAGQSSFNQGATIDGTLSVGTTGTMPGEQPQGGHVEISSDFQGDGVISLFGSAANSTSVAWTRGRIALPHLNVGPYGSLAIGGRAEPCTLSDCALQSGGKVTVLGPQLALNGQTLLHNLSQGTIEVTGDASLVSDVSSKAAVNNEGLFVKSGTGAASFGAAAFTAPAFNNDGVLHVRAGQMKLPGGQSSGQFQCETNALLYFWTGTHTFTGTNRNAFSGEGIVRIASELGAAPTRWIATGGLSLDNLELGDGAEVIGGGANTNSLIVVGKLLAYGAAVLDTGAFASRDVTSLGGLFLTNAVLTVSNTLSAAGELELSRSTLNINKGASGRFIGSSLAQAALRLDNSLVRANGNVALETNVLVSAQGTGTSTFAIGSAVQVTTRGAVRLQGTAAAPLVFDSAGLTTVEPGSLTFDGAYQIRSTGGMTSLHTATPDSLLVMATPLWIPPGNTDIFSGPGAVRIFGAEIEGRLQAGRYDGVAQQFREATVEVTNNISGSGVVDVLAQSGKGSTLKWLGGTLAVNFVNILEGARLLNAGPDPKELTRGTVAIMGVWDWAGAASAARDAIIEVQPSGMLDLKGASSVLQAGSAGCTIRNSGLLRAAGLNPNLIEATILNSGRLRVETSTLQVKGKVSQTGGETLVQAGATLNVPVLELNGGVLTGSGLLQGIVNNSAVVSPGAGIGTLTLDSGSELSQSSSGAVLVEIGGATPGVDLDQLFVRGKAKLAGKLEIRLVNGFVPAKGQTFQVLSAEALVGEFSGASGEHPPGTVWVPVHSGNTVSLTLVSQASLGAPSVAAGQMSFPFETQNGSSYHVQACADLDTAEWREIQTILGDGTVKTFTEPVESANKFYRVLVQ